MCSSDLVHIGRFLGNYKPEEAGSTGAVPLVLPLGLRLTSTTHNLFAEPDGQYAQ